jgi:conjugative transposon TraN protein
MRKLNNKLLGILLLGAIAAHAQIDSTNISNPEIFSQTTSHYKLPIDKISVKGFYPLSVSDIKTVHVIFPSKIREVDTGTPNILVQITESFDNILRVKALNLPEKSETNITILTEDGGLYSFLATYTKHPEILNINIGNNTNKDAIMSEVLGINSFAKADFIEEKLGQSLVNVDNNIAKVLDAKNFIKNVGEKSQNMTALLKGIYNAQEMQYYKVLITNNSEINFAIDFVKLYIKDVDKLAKTAVQSEELMIVKMLPTKTNIASKSSETYAFATKIKTLPIDKNLEIEIYEKNGGRHFRFPVDNIFLSKSKAL